ncbi:glycoside hydrolase [Geopyxis carbonaria]|nr:glycoside hydrolase [Geopyxis carbonaria]
MAGSARLRTLLLLVSTISLCVLSVVAAEREGAELILLNEIARASNQSLLWGPYRPNLYFGVKPRIPNSFAAGLLWTAVNDFESVQHTIRYQCEQGDNMAGYGWEEYDVRTGGNQVIRDPGNKIDIETAFVKVEGGQNGGNWGVRVKGTLREDASIEHKTTMVLNIGHGGLGSILLENEPDEKGLTGTVQLNGNLPQLGNFKVEITRGPESNHPPRQGVKSEWEHRPLDRTMYSSVKVPPNDVWKAKDVLFQKWQENFQHMAERHKPDSHPPPWQTFVLENEFEGGNLHFIQKVFEGDFEFDILFSSESAPAEMTSALLTEKIQENHETFTTKFNKVFKRQAPFDTDKYKGFAQNFFSNLLGGIGYFHGTSMVDRSYADEYAEEDEVFWEEALAAQKRPGAVKEEGPSELFTSIPSRPFFPRGFYWDEGFHLFPVADWDMDLTLNIVKSWFSLVDADGWIGREQILGDEARSKVPPEFQVQYPHYANPPTLFFILTKFIDTFEKAQAAGTAQKDPTESLEDNTPAGFSTSELPTVHLEHPEAAHAFLKELYPRLKRHYYWFRDTQKGEVRDWDRKAFSTKEAYRWRGRTPDHCLTSGLDDYPRAIPPHTGELHVDLLSWMGLMTRCIKRIASTIGEVDDAAEYARIETAVIRNVDDLHWSDLHQTYCDATIDAFEESVHVCHKGYISIFPVLLGLVPRDSPKLGKVLDLMEDPEQLWTPYGLRSLSKADALFGTGENYWKGPVWININFLAIQRLAEYAAAAGPHQAQAARIYEKLRKAVVENVYNEWKDTGYAWEQYDSVTGKGQRTAHFLGWTSAVVSIMAMPETVAVVPVPEAPKVQEEVRDEL